MNPWDLDATGLVVWGLVAHLVADWLLQNDWMQGKAWPWKWSVSGLLPGVVHAVIHAAALGLVFGYWPVVALGVAHWAIDTRLPVAWWGSFMRQTPPAQQRIESPELQWQLNIPRTVVDIGTLVRMANDQVFHVVCIAGAALVLA